MVFKNDSTKFFVECYFNKYADAITEEERKSLDVLTFDGAPEEFAHIDLSDLLLFPNVKKITIKNATLSKQNLEMISNSNVEAVYINKSVCEDSNDLGCLKSIKRLEIVRCVNQNYSFLANLPQIEQLAIANPIFNSPISMKYIAGMKNLRALNLQRCNIQDLDYLSNCQNLDRINFLWAQLPDNIVDVINSLKKLKRIYISKEHDMTGVRKDIEVKRNLIDLMLIPRDKPASPGKVEATK